MSLAKKVFIEIKAVKVSRQLDSLAVQEICQMNNLKFFEKLEIYSLVLLMFAVWLLFRQNPIEIIVELFFSKCYILFL